MDSGKAVIKSTHLGFEDHGIMTAYLHLQGQGWEQAFGGLFLDNGSTIDNTPGRVPSAGLGYFVERVLYVLHVDTWEQVAAKFVRYERDDGKVVRIGDILEDRWFDIRNFSLNCDAMLAKKRS